MLKDTPNYRVFQIIRLNDYPQITIDCTLAETLRANTNNDEISRLGWGVSYICQRLWHDNPSNARELGELIYIDSKSQDFIDSIPNETMKKIVKDILPRIEIKEFSKDSKNKCSTIKSQMQEIENNNLRFYIELDWDEFYMKFPLMKGLEKEMLSIYLTSTTYGYQGIPSPMFPTYNGKILTKKFLTQIQDFINNKQGIIKEIKDDRFAMQVTANLLEIAKNPKETNIPNVNNKIFSVANDSTNLQECERLLSDIKPSDLRRHQMQHYKISNIDFGLEYKLSFYEKSNQAIALYALSGKFQIYYVLDTFEVERISEKEIAIYPTQIKAYIDDSFDFRDQNHTFDMYGNIQELGQPVGAWDYKEMKFDRGVSENQMNKYAEKNGAFSISNIGAFFLFSIQENTAITEKKYLYYRQIGIYPNYNHDYQNTQKHFNLGCDFIVTSKEFKDIAIPKDLDTKSVFKIIVILKG